MKLWIVAIIGAWIALMLIGLYQANITGNIVKQEKVVIYFPTSSDYPSAEQGTAGFDFSFSSSTFMVDDKEADLLIFGSSKVVRGLKVAYAPKEKKVYAGLPVMTAETDLLNGQRHQLVYTFSKIAGKQALFLDGNLLVEGDYTGEEQKDSLTGYAMFNRNKVIESPFPLGVYFNGQIRLSNVEEGR